MQTNPLSAAILEFDAKARELSKQPDFYAETLAAAATDSLTSLQAHAMALKELDAGRGNSRQCHIWATLRDAARCLEAEEAVVRSMPEGLTRDAVLKALHLVHTKFMHLARDLMRADTAEMLGVLLTPGKTVADMVAEVYGQERADRIVDEAVAAARKGKTH